MMLPFNISALNSKEIAALSTIATKARVMILELKKTNERAAAIFKNAGEDFATLFSIACDVGTANEIIPLDLNKMAQAADDRDTKTKEQIDEEVGAFVNDVLDIMLFLDRAERTFSKPVNLQHARKYQNSPAPTTINHLAPVFKEINERFFNPSIN